MNNTHTFHIPVMGLSFTIDTPLKVSHLGMDSVISLCDDHLIEKMRRMYSQMYGLPYNEIPEKAEDSRAKRITMYLDMVHELAEKKFEELKNATMETARGIREYFELLPDNSSLKQEFTRLTSKYFNLAEIRQWLTDNMKMGSIDVNIMTKVDKTNYRGSEPLPQEFNDAHAALRGFARSNLRSSVVFSAGLSPRLYSYIAQFDDFFPDEKGDIRKKIILKVSDYRSALIQGKFLAKKGLWVSEYRIESGLNCGGHAFATEGHLMGPILANFRDKRQELTQTLNEMVKGALTSLGKTVPENDLSLKVTAQGGVGTADEHEFLLEHYQLDSVGWGTPFLLVPEATTVDEDTIFKLAEAKEDDLYLSNISPLGVPFNNLKGNTKDAEKYGFIESGDPGSPCPKRFLALNSEFTEKAICTASRQYQRLKLDKIEHEDLSPEEHKMQFNKTVEKSCLCAGLAASATVVNRLDATAAEGKGVLVCPGPNMAYFSKKMSLKEITDHIYGRDNMMGRPDRPNMFVKELSLYIDYLKQKVEETHHSFSEKQQQYINSFAENLNEGIEYYEQLFSSAKDRFEGSKAEIMSGLKQGLASIKKVMSEINVLA